MTCVREISFVAHTQLVPACSESGFALGLVKSTILWSPSHFVSIWMDGRGGQMGTGRYIVTPALYREIQSWVMTLSHPFYLSSLSKSGSGPS